MRRRSIIALAACLLWVALQPSPTSPIVSTEVRSMSVGQPQEWTPLASAISARDAWYAALPPPTTTTTTLRPRPPRARSGTVTTSAVDGDRFDRLAQCESGGDPTLNTGNGFYGAFQWVLSTWHAAGGTGNPVDHSYAEQKTLAMSWAQRSNPYTQWPVCWPRSA